MTGRRRGVLVLAGAALCVGAAYVSASYVLSPAVSDQGGGLASSSGYELRGSVGGPVISGGGEAASANYSLEVNQIDMLAPPPAPAPAPPPPASGGGGGGCAPGAGSPGTLAPLALALALATLALQCKKAAHSSKLSRPPGTTRREPQGRSRGRTTIARS